MSISPSTQALRRAFYGGNLDSAERAVLLAAYAAGVTANDVIALAGSSGTAVTSTDIDNVVKLTQAAFDALSPPNARTLYLIVG